MITNQTLTVSQMRHLIELGVDTSNASLNWFIFKEVIETAAESELRLIRARKDDFKIYDLYTQYEKEITYICAEILPAFTILDVIELLPEYFIFEDSRLEDKWLVRENGYQFRAKIAIDITNCLFGYKVYEYDGGSLYIPYEVQETYWEGETFYNFTEKPFTSCYDLLCWVIENKYERTTPITQIRYC